VGDRLQEQVNAAQARLQPGIDAIKTAHRGEERARRTLALYREAGVHPLYALKSLVGFLIQIPVFIAVFDMLAEDFDLYRVSFLWIQDLSRPDALLRLPGCLPFFGCDLNLLPFLMSGASLAALLRFRSAVLTPALARRQRRNLIGMTLLFFLLFYTFPAGMVLYWTSTNAFQLVIQEARRLGRAPAFTVAAVATPRRLSGLRTTRICQQAPRPRFTPRPKVGFVASVIMPCAGCNWICHLAEPYCVRRVPVENIIKAFDAIQVGHISGLQIQPLPLEPMLSLRRSDVSPLPSDHYVKATIPLYYEGHAYRAGSRIRVVISAPSGDQPIWAFAKAQPKGTATVSLAER
jgi:YidC/Oxa1 family membrane protein insertase